MTTRTRFAPSPTGSLHVGGVRTALYCLLLARRDGGQFVLRIEDTDQARSSDEAAAGIVGDLEWLGLTWDEGPGVDGPYGPYFQSQRLDRYDAAIDQLLTEGKAYEAWDTRAELTAARDAASKAKQNYVYRRREWTDDEIAAFRAEGRKPVVRLVVPQHPFVVADRVLGDVTIDGSEIEDLVIRKADGFPTYHLAVVVDDAHMQISLITRGSEHLKNTHKHRAIQEQLGLSPVDSAHLPLIFNQAGGKMSKREKAKAARAGARAAADGRQGWDWLAELTGRDPEDIRRFMKKKHDDLGTTLDIAGALDLELPLIDVLDFRRAGYLPEALVNYMALLGWSPGDDREIMTLDEMARAFSIERVGRTSARFDPDKLRWMNAEYLRASDDARVLAAIESWLQVCPESPLASLDSERRVALHHMFKQRVSTLAELDASARYFFEAPTSYVDKAVKKHLRKGGGFDNLRAIRRVLEQVESWTPTAVEQALTAFGESRELKLGKIAQPLRIALTGGPVSPPIFDTVAFFDRGEVLARIDRCLEVLDVEG